jgi:hypothetical protein
MIKTKWLVLVYCLSTLLFLVLPVYANPVQPLVARVFITQNGIPVDDTVDFSLDCFGVNKYHKNMDLERYGVKKVLNVTGDEDTVYAYSGTCRPGENCIVYKPDTPWIIEISHCDLSGTYKGQPFLLKNFSREPMMSSERMIVKVDSQKESYALHYAVYRECNDERSAHDLTCKIFLTKNRSTGVSETGPEYRQCRNESETKKSACIRNNGTWLNKTEVGDAISFYELSFDIPTENKTTGTITDSAIHTISPTLPRSPVESLYCGIMSVFNASC